MDVPLADDASNTGGIMTVAELINTYRLKHRTERRREDVRHARWWVEQVGTLPRGCRF